MILVHELIRIDALVYVDIEVVADEAPSLSLTDSLFSALDGL